MRRRPDSKQTTEVLYLSSVSSATQFQAMLNAQKAGAQVVTYGMPQSGNQFGTLIQAGLVKQPGVRLLALTGRSVHPRFHHGTYWRRARERIAPNWVIDHLGFPNAVGLRQLWLAASFALHALRWRWRTRKTADRVFIADAAYITALPAALAALSGSNVRRLAIFADIYVYMGQVADASERGGIFFDLLRRVAAASYAQLDGFIFLTTEMSPVVNPQGRPFIVMEGLVDQTPPQVQGPRNNRPTVLYAGALRREYGLHDLIEGFRAYPDPRAELIIYGDGEYAAELRQISAADPRIDYRGSAPREEVLAAEQQAWLLVNPRPVDQEFTRFSFPSKNMEYMASGTAVLTTRLPGMPAEYYEHVFSIEGTGAPAITKALHQTLGQGLEALDVRGRRAQRFVLDEKNNHRQAARILAFALGL